MYAGLPIIDSPNKTPRVKSAMASSSNPPPTQRPLNSMPTVVQLQQVEYLLNTKSKDVRLTVLSRLFNIIS